jgi:hypothetical protein
MDRLDTMRMFARVVESGKLLERRAISGPRAVFAIARRASKSW